MIAKAKRPTLYRPTWSQGLVEGPSAARRARPAAVTAGGDLAARAAYGYRAGMDLSYPPEAEEFRGTVRSWLEENLPDGWGTPAFSMTTEERNAFYEEWNKKLFAGGWICAGWPPSTAARASPSSSRWW